jgi:hypothetical protein
MNDLNSNFVLWISLAALALTIAAFIAFAWKTARAMEGLEKDENKDENKEENKDD